MSIGIAARLYSLNGAIVLHNIDPVSSRMKDTSRRSTKVATLDGGAVLVDFGYSDADRTLAVDVITPSPDQIDTLTYLHKYHSLVTVSLSDGCYKGTISRMSETQKGYRLTIELLTKESE